MFIQTETTPNPATLKFLPGVTVMPADTADYRNAEEAGNSPLALRLFQVHGVQAVFLGSDFVTVTKSDDVDWHVLKSSILGAIMEHLMAGLPVVEGEDEGAGGAESYAEADAEIVSQIKELLETRVRPAVAQDGGDIVFRGYEEGIVYLHMQGACAGCPSSTATLKHGIENMLRHFVPEVSEVRPV
ncbi:MAG: NifU family protein [Sneathiellaceae bacterium]